MKKLLLIFLVGAFVGCKNFETKKLSSEQIMQEEMENIDFENLDSYPSFEICDKYSSQEDKKQCFSDEITIRIFQTLGQHEVILKDSVYEKIEMTINISSNGTPELAHAVISDSLKNEIPEIENWLEQALKELPTIYPAEKRGVPVSSSFKLPLVIESQ